jgi:hypothetical protein
MVVGSLTSLIDAHSQFALLVLFVLLLVESSGHGRPLPANSKINLVVSRGRNR